MNTKVRLTIAGGVIIGAAALLLPDLTPSATPPPGALSRKGQSVIPRGQSRPARQNEGPLLPSPVLTPASNPPAPVPVPALAVGPGLPATDPFVRPEGESIMSSWAARDPETAGLWLNQNRHLPQFADYVRGYAIQIATIDPNAARQWAATLNGNGNRFPRGGTLEQHIDAIELMQQNPFVTPFTITKPGPSFFADYTPVLVRQRPDEAPVLEMQPVTPFG